MAKIANEILKTQNPSFEKDSTITWVYVEYKQRQNIKFASKGKKFSPNDQIHGWNGNYIRGQKSAQKCEIQ